MAIRVNTNTKGLAVSSSTAQVAARARERGSNAGRQRLSRNQDAMAIPPKTATVSARTAVSETPVNSKTPASSRGQTGSATAGLKSPATYQWPRSKWRIAASPYQPSSVYLDQSFQGELLGKSAVRCTACSANSATAANSRTTCRVA